MTFDFPLNPLVEAFERRYCFDIETNGLLKEVSLFFCAVIENVDNGDIIYYAPENFEDFLKELSRADWLIGHNIIGYDLPALKKLCGWTPDPDVYLYDTLVASRMYNPKLEMHPDCPRKVWNAHEQKMKNVGPHTLMNLGYYVGCQKGDFGEDHAFDEYCPEMLAYCAQDVTVNVKIFRWLEKKLRAWSPISIQCEMEVATYITEQIRYGWYFDIEGADELRNDLIELKTQIETEVRERFIPIYKPHTMENLGGGERAPKVTQPRVTASGGLSSVGLKAFLGEDWEDMVPVPEYRRFPGHIEYHSGSFTKLKIEEFNLGSRSQIAHRLQMAGVVLTKKTKKGNFIVDDGVLNGLAKKYPDIPEVILLKRYFKVSKILSMVENWIDNYDWDTGRIHGFVNPLGAITNRMTHSSPNVAQTPSATTTKCHGAVNPNTGHAVINKDAEFVLLICSDSSEEYNEGDVVLYDTTRNRIVSRKYTHEAFVQTPSIIADAGFSLVWGEEGDWGADCRNLFTVPDNHVLVGADASGLELRCLAHYMNDETYTDLILNGDIHSYNQKLAGLPTRGDAKTFIYAFLYGAGDAKIGTIVGGKSKEGKALKERFLSSLPKLKRLLNRVRDKVEQTGAMGVAAVRGVDGRRIRVISAHAALNSLLQSCGALVCKYWLIAIIRECRRLGLRMNAVGNIHDEVQLEVHEDDVAEVERVCIEAMPAVGDWLKFRCPLAAEADHGTSWAYTH